MRRGFTLLEALAAVVTLGLLAVAVVPMMRQLGQLGIAERMQAQYYLRALPAQDDLAPGAVLAVAGHPGWRLVVSDLIAEAEPPPPTGCAPPAGPAHHWLRVGIQADASGMTLAETLVAVLTPGVQP